MRLTAMRYVVVGVLCIFLVACSSGGGGGDSGSGDGNRSIVDGLHNMSGGGDSRNRSSIDDLHNMSGSGDNGSDNGNRSSIDDLHNMSGGGDNGSLNIEVKDLGGEVEVRPHEIYALLEWSLPSGDIDQIRIEVRRADGRLVEIEVADVTETRWRVEGLMEGADYKFQIIFTFADGTRGFLSSGEDAIRTGLNTDNDFEINEIDSDDDNDGLLDNDTKEQLMNRAGISCSLLADCDGDRVEDRLDAFPDDPTETVDTDGDKVGDNADMDDDGDGVEDTAEGRLHNRRGEACLLLADCDGDGVDDGADLDIDGDHLIEVRTQRELDAIRFVLDGTGRRFSDTGDINTSGCASCRGYELLNDIVLSVSDPAGWQPIGKDLTIGLEGGGLYGFGARAYCRGEGFTGTLEGNGWTIANLTIDRYDAGEVCVGFFGLLSGEVRNLRIEANEIRGRSPTGILAASARHARVVSSHVGRFVDVATMADADGLDLFSNGTIGGLVGSMHLGSIIDSSAQTDLIEAGRWQVGGLVGATWETTIYNSTALNGRVIGGVDADYDRGVYAVGGLVGRCFESRIHHSFAISEHIEVLRHGSDEDFIGGLGGYCAENITYSYALTGNITGRRRIGGLIGQDGSPIGEQGTNTHTQHSFAMTEKIDAGRNKHVGGLVGLLGTDTNAHSLYAVTGTIIGGNEVGGLVGSLDNLHLSSSYALTGTIDGRESVGGLGGDKVEPKALGIDSSYAVTHTLQGTSKVGGLIGSIGLQTNITISGSYAMVADLTATSNIGKLVGETEDSISILASYAVVDGSNAPSNLGNLVGTNQSMNSIVASYGDDLTDPQRTSLLQGSTSTLEADWRNNNSVGDRAVWCDTNHNARIDGGEVNPSSGTYVWDFGQAGEYPHIQCTPPLWSAFPLMGESWRTLVAGKLDIPDTEELTQKIREFRGERRRAFLGKLIIPYEDAILLRWYHPRRVGAGVTGIMIDVQQDGGSVRQIPVNDLRLSAYRVEGLVAGQGYEFEVIFSYDDNSEIRLHSDGEVFAGTNRDQDGLIDALDPDDDNDGLVDGHAREQMVNGDGISCSLLEDCDDDGILDRDDSHPTDPQNG